MRALLAPALITCVLACGGNKNGDGDGDGGVGADACVGIECDVVDCAATSQPPTSISGTVFAPNGTLPLAGVNVYVPRDLPLPPFTEGVTCERCAAELPGSPVVEAVSDAAGNFKLENIPAGVDLSLVITTGKWRRIVQVPAVTQCTDTALGVADTRLPRNRTEGEIPRIAITTGDADTLECLVRKLGVDDAEIGASGDDRRIHLYRGNGTGAFRSGFGGGSGNLPSATPFWSTLDGLRPYDIVFLSCEGAQNPGTKPQDALNAMKMYADLGGRVFASHWHNIWVGGNFQDNNRDLAPDVWPEIGEFPDGNGTNFDDGPITTLIDEADNPKGSTFADWMVTVGGSTVRGEIPVNEARTTMDSLSIAKAEQWVVTKADPNYNPAVPGGRPQMLQFTTPLEAASDQRCGKVVFTDMHVSGTSRDGDYPNNCVGGADNLELTPQEKALAFMFFDISSCVGGIF